MKKVICLTLLLLGLLMNSGCGFDDVMEKMGGSSDLEEAKWDLTYWDECKWQ